VKRGKTKQNEVKRPPIGPPPIVNGAPGDHPKPAAKLLVVKPPDKFDIRGRFCSFLLLDRGYLRGAVDPLESLVERKQTRTRERK
jgi:hypothetical protein